MGGKFDRFRIGIASRRRYKIMSVEGSVDEP
jgi:hypothetical protein